jgi:hypothetical protein
MIDSASSPTRSTELARRRLVVGGLDAERGGETVPVDLHLEEAGARHERTARRLAIRPSTHGVGPGFDPPETSLVGI